MTQLITETPTFAVPRESDEGEARRQRLARFLRARREQLRPQDVGLPSSNRRRTPGLRREEVAVLANVGVTWYTWLEQGRDIGVSSDVIDAIGQALRLEEGDLEHLYELAGKQQPVRRSAVAEVRAIMSRTLAGFTHSPAYAVDRYWNVIATNELAEYVFGISVGSNCLEAFFTKPDVAAHYPHRELAGRMMAAQFHRQAAMYAGDPIFGMLADKIAAVSPEFKEYWDSYVVGVEPHVDLVFDHNQLGRLTLESVVLNPVGGNDLRVFLYLPKVGSGTAEALARAV
ncbi:helix-turn-helix transcriptional regulator [Arthrobacter oryzae]|uniref:helix-turn-helix transcriptional regulator n=1 Tax=Arthrobacter oryzae TaxID=409290 RepID=UPI00273B6C23|nr:helix-turn-helix transcriptional regulator [Arthrobacter oryzae]WLQ08102.1 helix-turn-helix transcriptional regulator [Arthrobacter oryzae]